MKYPVTQKYILAMSGRPAKGEWKNKWWSGKLQNACIFIQIKGKKSKIPQLTSWLWSFPTCLL